METILFRQGDSYPLIYLTIKDKATGDPTDPETWDPIRLDDENVSVRVEFKRRGASGVVATAPCTKLSGGADGKVVFSVPPEVSAEVGIYDGQIIIDHGGPLETLDQEIKIKVRSR